VGGGKPIKDPALLKADASKREPKCSQEKRAKGLNGRPTSETQPTRKKMQEPGKSIILSHHKKKG